MALQYIGTIDNIKEMHDKELNDLKATLDAALLQLRLNQVKVIDTDVDNAARRNNDSNDEMKVIKILML